MYLEIITPDKKIFEGEVKLVKVPGNKGAFEMLENHAPIVSTLGEGEIKIICTDDTIQRFDISAGVIESKKNKAVILAETK